MPSSDTKATFSFVTLGCPKNLVDSETMLGKLAVDGYTLQTSPEGSDVVVINTCGFIEDSRRESLGVIREMLDLKRAGKVKAVVVAGCLAERKHEDLLQEVPDVDHIVGVFGRDEIVRVVDNVLARAEPASGNGSKGPLRSKRTALATVAPKADLAAEQRALFRPAPVKAQNDQMRLRITPRHYAYLKISEGCDRLCTFCAIPKMRGKHVSKPIDMVLAEARELVADGVRELILVAQDTTYYGLDLYGEPRLAELLRELDRLDGLDWIRILYVYPMYLTDELLTTLGAAKKIIPYLDMPLQHINDTMLRRMARRVTRAETETILARLRQAMSGLVLRTTFIVGFPGETEDHFAELCEFVQDQKFERVGVFTYSLEPDTPAERLEDQIPEEIKQDRRGRLMALQQPIAFAWNAAQVGREMDVIIDAADPEMPGWFVGRGHADAPDIDGVVRVKGKNLAPGDIARVKITAAEDYDLLGKVIKTR
jgi:ribosomal protein S12 methylthiotransferase